MLQFQRDWNLAVLFLSAGAYVPLAIGGWVHPSEINIAAYSLWLVLSGMLLYSSHAQDFAGWRMPLGFFVGNLAMIVLALIRGGSTFNLGSAESVILYGIIATLSVWVAIGQSTGRWNPRILFIGGVSADILSFYPQIKQYLEPHEVPSDFMLLGWGMWIAGACINVIFVERLPFKLRMDRDSYQNLYHKNKSAAGIIEESLFSIENGLFMIATVLVMTH